MTSQATLMNLLFYDYTVLFFFNFNFSILFISFVIKSCPFLFFSFLFFFSYYMLNLLVDTAAWKRKHFDHSLLELGRKMGLDKMRHLWPK
jgi:hypothetical protein